MRLDNVTNTKRQDIKAMIDMGRYFSIFAPRQSGKSTFLEGIRNDLHHDKTYVVILLSFQDYKNLTGEEFYSLIEKELYEQLRKRLSEVGCEKAGIVFSFLEDHHLKNHLSLRFLFEELNRILRFKKIVVFIDEFDGIPLSELENFLTSLRTLYLKYKTEGQKALYSVGLIGIRNITKLIVGGVSPFNIADQVFLPPFSLENVRDLYTQYSEETHQRFAEEAIKRVYEQTGGQPWLVNRLGTILTTVVKPGTVDAIDEKDVEKGVLLLLQERNVHFDNLSEKAHMYKEAFIEIVFDHIEYDPEDKDQSWLEQFGLIRNRDGRAVVANNIYKARYIRAFFKEVNTYEKNPLPEYELPGNRLDIERIIVDFGRYITQVGVRAFYEHDKPYEKTGQFQLTAWLYPFVKGGEGELRYEVFSGLGRMDILLVFKGRKYIIETKVNRYEDLSALLEEGIHQVSRKYLASEGVDEGYLVIFDVKRKVGAACKPEYHHDGQTKVTVFNIAIGRTDPG